MIKFPSEDLHQNGPGPEKSSSKDESNDESENEADDLLEPQMKKSKLDHRPCRSNHKSGYESLSNLRHLYLRNIRNVKSMTCYQSSNLKSFVQFQHNLNTLDLIGLYLSSQFIESILINLNQLK
jgi:hypothetical protein